MAIEEANIIVDQHSGERLDRVVQQLTGRSRSDVRGLFDHGGVWLNGAPCEDSAARVQPGDLVTVRHDPHRRYREKPKARPSHAFRVVFEDNFLLVVDKAPGILTVPTDRGETYTLLEAVDRYLKRRREQAALVHRLDRDTSGLLVFAKNRRIAAGLQTQFRAHTVQREYAAIVAGTVTPAAGTFSSRLGTSKSLHRYSVGEDEEGEPAVTHYRVERVLDGASFLKVWLETGRRNQIRVHFAEANHPVLGDSRYRPSLAQHPRWPASRLALHAAVLGFVHPRTDKPLRFESPLPREFERFLAVNVSV